MYDKTFNLKTKERQNGLICIVSVSYLLHLILFSHSIGDYNQCIEFKRI